MWSMTVCQRSLFYALSHLTLTYNYRPVNQVLLLPHDFHIVFVTPSNIYARLFHAEDVECHTYLIPCRDLQQKISGDWFVATLLTNVSPTRTERHASTAKCKHKGCNTSKVVCGCTNTVISTCMHVPHTRTHLNKPHTLNPAAQLKLQQQQQPDRWR